MCVGFILHAMDTPHADVSHVQDGYQPLQVQRCQDANRFSLSTMFNLRKREDMHIDHRHTHNWTCQQM